MGALLLFWFALVAGCARAYERSSGPIDRMDLPVKISKIRGNLYLAEDFNYWKTNSLFYAGPEGIFFVDAGWSHKSARQILWKASTLSSAGYEGIVVTSYRIYRTGGLSAFQNSLVPVFLSKRSERLLRKNWRGMQEEMSRSFSSWRPQARVLDYSTFEGEKEFLRGRVRVFYPGPAHTEDNLIVYFPEEKVLYAGSILSPSLSFMKEARPDAYREVLRRLSQFDADIIVAGHGPALHDPSLLKRVEREVKLYFDSEKRGGGGSPAPLSNPPGS